MLAHSRIHRAEAKYNVTTDFPHLGLHSAAATGNVGLVNYALSHGQPVNSVLDGVLPLHAASSGGNDFVVRLLIEHGADVNAPRLPRRYSDRNRDNAAPIVGTSGSTPLHFAAANGHTTVIRTLLTNGAHADQSDKHGVTPQMLARQNGWVESADVLQAWLANQERTFKVRGESPPSGDPQHFRGRSASSGAIESFETSIRKRLHLKRSVDNALNAFRPTGTPELDINSPPTRESLSGEEFSSNGTGTPANGELATHKSPQLHHENPPSPRRPSAQHTFEESSRRPSTLSTPSRVSRPRSAGTGAEPVPHLGRLNSKLSLLSLFKKSNVDGSSSSFASDHSPSPSSMPSISSPAPGSIPLPVSPRSITTPLSSSPKDSPAMEYHRRRMGSSSRRESPHAVETRTAVPIQQPRDRSASGGSRASMTPNEDIQEAASPPVRPGILLRLHNRSSSSGRSQGSAPQSSSRIIRFNASPNSSSPSGRALSPGARYGGTNQSLEGRYRATTLETTEDRFGISPSTPIEENPPMHESSPPSAPPIVVGMADDDDDAEDFGVFISRPTPDEPHGRTISLSPTITSEFPFNINEPPPSDDLIDTPIVHGHPRQLENRGRGESISSTDSYNPQSSGSSATWTSNGSVTTPNTPYLSLPSPYVTSGSLGRSAEIQLSPSQRPPLSPNPKVGSLPMEIDIHAISSRAQAEELVQRAQESILNMDQFVQEVFPRSMEDGRSTLSERLAAFGETLAIERKLKAQEDVRGGRSSVDQGSTGLTPTSTRDPTLVPNSRSAQAMTRSQSSGRLQNGPSDGAMSVPVAIPGHIARPRIPNRSASDDIQMDRPIGQIFSPEEPLIVARALTPEPANPIDTLVPLSRVTTAPVQLTLSSIPSRRGDQAKHIMSANKLTRMGFSTSDGWQPPPPPTGGISKPTTTKHKFGGIRTLMMQTFQGKQV